MDINRLQTFLKVAQYGSFQKVSEQEYVSQRAVSKQMTQLESELNVTLFHRGKNQISLTAQGHLFLSSAQDIVNNYLSALTELRQTDSQEKPLLRVGYFSAFEQQLLLKALYTLKLNVPDLQLIVRQGSNEHLTQSVTNGALDLALSISYGKPALPDDSPITALPIYHNQMVMGVSRLNPLSRLTALPQTNLTDRQMLYYSPENSTFLLESFLASAPFIENYEDIHRVSSAEQMHMLVALDQAFAFYPKGLTPPDADKNVAYLPIENDTTQEYTIETLYAPHTQNKVLKQLIGCLTGK
ncbi:LysR family transcriptional regulator [Secundilactobacillus collinoides]|uniref:Transcription regulator n=2 Tax=Secundilactobacillus collinoides TaxID=33960 RepID=A0A0R2B5H1_SECCO|nr:LysR family transcriptional regulator [Secundilactobacillus collinoides]KRM74765.1 transcription regulator [Secundilactobacillus collinoides DSM 20515 = JCM 1123]KZL42696.1 LysR family transcriptional regulator [Secundilactobacillus collinoides]